MREITGEVYLESSLSKTSKFRYPGMMPLKKWEKQTRKWQEKNVPVLVSYLPLPPTTGITCRYSGLVVLEDNIRKKKKKTEKKYCKTLSGV